MDPEGDKPGRLPLADRHVQQLDQRAIAARLKIAGHFDQPLQAGYRPDELAAIQALTRDIWTRLETLAGDVSTVKDRLRQRRAADIFDESATFTLPRFKVRAYRRGK
jgi:alkanesulfonate monooxygenase SsuD/methylene tetrahydromethanopterin reductase-like flavin-dependent oxidoreductase (luciferase family)